MVPEVGVLVDDEAVGYYLDHRLQREYGQESVLYFFLQGKGKVYTVFEQIA